MKHKINLLTHCYHATPNGKGHIGEQQKLKKQFEQGVITERNLKRLASFMVIAKRNNQYTEVKLFGVWRKIKDSMELEILIKENFELR